MKASLVKSEAVTGQEVITSATEAAANTANDSHSATRSVADVAASVSLDAAQADDVDVISGVAVGASEGRG